MVYAPAHPDPRRGRQALEFEIRQLADGVRALPVFSTRERLVEALGPAQPWALLPLRAARALMAAAGIPSVVLDPEFTVEAWRWDEQDLVELGRIAG
jgi:SseB protein N-terminal domain